MPGIAVKPWAKTLSATVAITATYTEALAIGISRVTVR
jgi:hypothetical protein